jgi:hypothetical protein
VSVLSVEDYHRRVAAGMKEAELQRQVQLLATGLGWKWYHPADSNRVVAGYPDLTLVKGRRLIFSELKQQKAYPTVQQREWHDLLSQAGVEVFVWRPLDLLDGSIAFVLRGVGHPLLPTR